MWLDSSYQDDSTWTISRDNFHGTVSLQTLLTGQFSPMAFTLHLSQGNCSGGNCPGESCPQTCRSMSLTCDLRATHSENQSFCCVELHTSASITLEDKFCKVFLITQQLDINSNKWQI